MGSCPPLGLERMVMECREILKAARDKEEKGDLSKAAELYHKASICFGMYNDFDEYENLKMKSGELFLAASRLEQNPVLAIKYGTLAHRTLAELNSPLAAECSDILIRLISNNLEALLTEKEVCVSAAVFMASQGRFKLASELYASLARKCLEENSTQRAASLYSNAAACKEEDADFRGSYECNEIAGKLFMACGLDLEASQHFVKSFLEGVLVGEINQQILKLSDELCFKDEVESTWHMELISLCKDLSKGDVSSARKKWLFIRHKFKPSFQSMVERAIEKVDKGSWAETRDTQGDMNLKV